ncbi:LOW QUALITY PROTEIN: hypothetical protein U9M48_000203 [Paspalum notatum var. saurae]|uniref:Reverse transcriptase n=1 Tax=Paspalum notatum var. saurae TaxID=547442 RepID=A0AAQ3PEK0_PASNO
MDPSIKLLVDELHRRFDELNTKWDQRLSDSEKRQFDHVDRLEAHYGERLDRLEAAAQVFDDWRPRLEARLSDSEKRQFDHVDRLAAHHGERLDRLEAAALVFDDWRPRVEATVDDVKLDVNKLSRFCNRAVFANTAADGGILPIPKSAAERPPVSEPPADGPFGHRVHLHHRDDGYGSVYTVAHHPVKGTHHYHPPSFFECPPHRVEPGFHHPLGSGPRLEQSFHRGSSQFTGSLPKLHFPSFDGENPKLWLSRCQDYFDLYSVDPIVWVRVAAMHLQGAASRWWQSVEPRLKGASWSEFGCLVSHRFGRNQQEALILQLFNMSQTGSTKEYVERFTELVDQLGLRDDIRATVLIQQPQSLDTACSLALVQDEVADSGRRREYRQPYSGFHSKSLAKGPQPLPQPPRVERPAAPSTADKTSGDPAKAAVDKFSALRSFRRAWGLCDRCAEKWSPGHKCNAAVQLNALQELFDIFEPVDSVPEDAHSSHSADQLFIALSQEALSGSDGPRTLRMMGFIQDKVMLILVDSGSSHSFISQSLAQQLSGHSKLASPMSVRVANGAVLQRVTQLEAATWEVQGYQFSSDLKILPLQHFDLILGMDWLEAFSPMRVHWKQKWIAVPYLGSTAVLHGISSALPDQLVVQLCSMSVPEQLDSLSQSLCPALAALITEFGSLFEPVAGLSSPRHCDHTIPLVAGAKPVHIRPYRYPPALKDEIESQVRDLLDKGLIQPSNSPFSSPMLLVKKKDGSWWPVVDYRHLNALTIRGKFPIPVFDELMDELSGATWFSSLDLNSGFHQIRLRPGEEPKTAFQTHFGHFEYRVMSFGLCGAPGTFQGAMNATLHPLLRKCVLVFFDDILSKSLDDHIRHLKQVFQLLSQDQWKVKLSKCSFAQRQISYLGHVISSEGVSTDSSKVDAVTSWPTPTNVKELRSFLGLTGYYRKFVRHFAIIARPLTDLLKKHALFVWSSEHQSSFDALKQALSSAPVLAMLDFSHPFCIETDACTNGVGAVLLQGGHPLAYISKPLGPKSMGLSTYEKEYLAILLAVEQWRTYLTYQEFLIYTDQRSLTHLSDQRLNTPWQQRVFTKLLGLQYRVIYKPGNDNRVADALSRRSHNHGELHSLSVCSPAWMSEILLGYQADPATQTLLAKLAVLPDAVPHFTLQQGILRYKKRIWLGTNVGLQQKVLSALHDNPAGGHSGFPVTYRRMKQLFAWKGMKSDVKLFVSSCQTCQQAKPDRARSPGLRLPLPVPSSAWQIITMDFMEGLPRSSGKDCILVIVDKFTKYGHFVGLSHPFSAASVARVFFDSVYRLHGLPESIVSDRDKIFTSLFWQKLFKLAGVSLRLSSSYHPQSDGQTERVNQCLETFLRCYVHACPARWMDWLGLAEYWYNTSTHSAIGRSPFEALYGYPPRSLGIVPSDMC